MTNLHKESSKLFRKCRVYLEQEKGVTLGWKIGLALCFVRPIDDQLSKTAKARCDFVCGCANDGLFVFSITETGNECSDPSSKNWVKLLSYNFLD